MNKRKQKKWKPPTITTLKLNFDGATKNGLVAVGGVLRDGNGRVLLLYARKIGQGTNNMAERMALLWGLQAIKEMQIKEITIEGDSKIIIDMMRGDSQ